MPSFTATNSIDIVGSQVVTGGLTIGAVTQGAEVTSGLKVTTGGATIDAGGLTVTLGGATVSAGGLTVSAGAATVPYLSLTGISSDVNAGARFVGGIASGAPLGGSYLVGDVVVDRTGKIWICTTAGSPGTWTQVSGSGGGGGGSGTVTSVAALTIGTSGTDIDSSVANSTTTPVITLNIPTASASNRGALSSADWTTFNAKQSGNANLTAIAATGTPAISGVLRKFSDNTWSLDETPYYSNSYYIQHTSASGGTFGGAANSRTKSVVLYSFVDADITSGAYTKTAVSITSSGAWTATGAVARGLYVTATGATTNYAAIFDQGNVGIGTTSPGTALEVYGSITARPASTNDAVIIAGRAGGTSSYGITLLSGTLSASRTLTLPDVTGTLVTTGDTGTVTSTMLSGSIANAKLLNSSVTVNGSSISLGGSATVTANTTNALTIDTGLSGTSSTFNGSAANTISLNVGNANTWTAAQTFSNATYSALFTGGNVGIRTTSPGTALEVYGSITARPASTNDAVIIAGRAGGTSSYGVTLVSGTLTASRTLTLPDVTGTLVTTGDTGTVTSTMLSGSIANAKLLNSSVTVNGSSISLGGSATVTANTTNALTIGTGLSGTSSTFNGSAANTISLNVGNANTWTAAQTFNAGITINNPSSTSLFTIQAFGNTVYSIESGPSQITHVSYSSAGSVPPQTWWFENIAATTLTKIATLNANGLAVGGSHSPQQAIDIKGVLRLNGTTANTNYTQLQSAATPSTNMTYTFPATAPSAGQILSSDASGNLSWVANSGGGGGGASLSVANTWTAKQTFSNKAALSDSSASPAPFWGTALTSGLTLANGDISTSVWTVDPESGIVIGLFTSSADSIGMPTTNGMAIAAPSYGYSAVGTVDSTYNGAFEISSSLRLKSSATATDFVELRAPAGASSSASYVLPNNLPAKDGYILNATTQGQMAWQYQNAIEPIIADDISPYFNGSSAVFPLTNNLVKISNIIDSKDAEVIVNGRRLVPYVQELRYPWIAEYDAYRGFRVRDGKLILFNAPKSGEQASVMVKTISQKVATRKYPFSASTIALGD